MGRLMTSNTPLRWHRRLVRPRRTYPRCGGRPPIDAQLALLIKQMAQENLRLGIQAVRGNLPGLDDESGHPQCGGC